MDVTHSCQELEAVKEDKVLLEPDDLAVRLENGDVLQIDTCDLESFNAGHIPGAVNAHDIFHLSRHSPEPYRSEKARRERRTNRT